MLKRFKIAQKLNLLGYVGVAGLVLSSITVWIVLQNLHTLSTNIQSYSGMNNRASNIRVGYNGIHSDLLLLFSLNPNVPKEIEKANYVFENYKQTEATLVADYNKLLEESKKDPDIELAAKDYINTLDEFLKLVNANAEKIKNVTPEDSIGNIACKQVLYYEMDDLISKLKIGKEKLVGGIEKELIAANNDFEEANNFANILVIVISVLVVLVVTILSRIISRNIANRLKYVSNTLDEVSKGGLPDVQKFDDKDEIGGMTHSFTNLVDELNHLREFTVAVGTGNYETDIVVFNNQGQISNALVEMKQNLKVASELKFIQTYVSEGLAKFATILRNQHEEHYFDNIISNLVKYVGANQGALFIVNDDNPKDTFLEMASCYAWDKKKYINARIGRGEGLVGQAWLEGGMIYLTEIPENYITITSGLGDANPHCVLILPLVINENTYGVIEIASFKHIEDYQKDFLVKLSESIASTLSSVKTNERTKILLQQSQQQTEEMRAQEEEMRQNMEEMEATQEEMERKSLEMNHMVEKMAQKEEELRQNMEEMVATQEELEKQKSIIEDKIKEAVAEAKGIVDGVNATMATIEFTPNGEVISANENFIKTMKCSLADILGKHHRTFVPESILISDDYKTFWTRLASGEPIRGVFERINSQSETVWLNAIYNPILNAKGEVVKVIKFANDITAEKLKEFEIKQLLDNATAQEEEIRQNLEEMSAISDDLDKQLIKRTEELKVREDVFGITSILSESDIYGNVIYANPKLLEVSKYSSEEVMGKPHNLFRHPDMPKELFKLFWTTIKSGEVFKGVIKNRAKDGSHYWVDGCFVPVKDDNGNIVKYIGARYHITDDAMAQKLYDEQMKRLGL